LQGCVNGNAEPDRGLGHITSTVDGVEMLVRIAKLGLGFEKKPETGR
jgi:hypothetical protein